MSAQTSYEINTPERTHGNLADIRESEIVTRLAEGSAIGVGVVVSVGTGDHQAVIGGAVAGIEGVTVKDLSLEAKAVGDATLEYRQGDPMSVIKSGAICIQLASGGAKGDALKYDTTTGAIDAGAPAAGEVALPLGYSLENTVGANGVGIIRLSGQNV